MEEGVSMEGSNPAFNTAQKGVTKIRGMLGEYEDDIIMFVKFKKPQTVDAIVTYVHSLPNGGLFNAEKIAKKVQHLTDAGRMPPVGPQPVAAPGTVSGAVQDTAPSEPKPFKNLNDFQHTFLSFLGSGEGQRFDAVLKFFTDATFTKKPTDDEFGTWFNELLDMGIIFEPTPNRFRKV